MLVAIVVRMETLKKIQKHVILVVLCGTFFISLGANVATAEGELDPFLAILDEVRRSPHARAVSLDVGGDNIPSWLDGDFNLPSFELDSFLCARAEALNLEGEVPEEEPSAVNDFVRTGEINAEIAFFNYLSQKTAFQIVVDTIFKRELEETGGELKLLDPEFTRVGIAIRAGFKQVDGVDQNAYFVTICFGSSQLRSAVQVLNMVNQVRAKPGTVEKYLGVSFFDLLNCNFNYLSEWFNVYPPLMGNVALHAAAQSYSTQLVDPEPASSPLDFAPDAGYGEALEVTASVTRAALPVVEATSAQVADTVFQNLVRDELAAVPERGSVFSLDKNDGGVGISFASVEDQVDIASVLAAGTPVVVDDGKVDIYGVVYVDEDENTIYSPGEGHGLVTVKVFRKSDNVLLDPRPVTDFAGHFSLRLDPYEWYIFKSFDAGEIVDSREVRIDGEDLFLPIKLQPVPDPDPAVESME